MLIAEPGSPKVRFFYSDGSVTEVDPESGPQLGYVTESLLAARRRGDSTPG